MEAIASNIPQIIAASFVIGVAFFTVKLIKSIAAFLLRHWTPNNSQQSITRMKILELFFLILLSVVLAQAIYVALSILNLKMLADPMRSYDPFGILLTIGIFGLGLLFNRKQLFGNG